MISSRNVVGSGINQIPIQLKCVEGMEVGTCHKLLLILNENRVNIHSGKLTQGCLTLVYYSRMHISRSYAIYGPFSK